MPYATATGGTGFCHAALPELLPPGYHGPLVIAWAPDLLDSLQRDGIGLLRGPRPEEMLRDRGSYDEWQAVAALAQVWTLRDLRFVSTPQGHEVLDPNLIDALADLISPIRRSPTRALESMAAQVDVPPLTAEDRQLLRDVLTGGAHVLMTRDDRLIRRFESAPFAVKVHAPTTVAGALILSGVGTVARGGLCDEPGCMYAAPAEPIPNPARARTLLRLISDRG